MMDRSNKITAHAHVKMSLIDIPRVYIYGMYDSACIVRYLHDLCGLRVAKNRCHRLCRKSNDAGYFVDCVVSEATRLNKIRRLEKASRPREECGILGDTRGRHLGGQRA